jgi:ATP-binding cassette subfamily C protein LapB
VNTRIGGSAVDTLSEGLRQKIIMVRALVGLPRVMLFDDANAGFDLGNDARFADMIKGFKGNHTLVIVSHRPSLLRICDRRFALANGSLIEVAEDHPVSPAIPLRAAAN